jgi:hypothetical protein
MLFNNEHSGILRPNYINDVEPRTLHRFEWVKDEQIGGLPLEWNYLVGEDGQSVDVPKNIHFTNGTPCFEEYKNCEYADLWRAEQQLMNQSLSRIYHEGPTIINAV